MSIDALIERLERSRTDFWAHTRMDCLREAADALASTQEAILRLRKAMEPFAKLAEGLEVHNRRYFLQLLVCPEGDTHHEDWGERIRSASRSLHDGERK